MKRIIMIAIFLGALALSATQAEAQQYGYHGAYYGGHYAGYRGYSPAIGFNYNVYRPYYYGPQVYSYPRAYSYPAPVYAYPGYPGYAYPPYGAYGGFSTPGFSFYFGR